MTAETLDPVTGRRHGRAALLVMVLSAFGLAAIVLTALNSSTGQSVDDAAMNAVTATNSAEITVLGVLGNVSIGAILTIAVICVAIALLRRRFRLAVGALTIIAGSNVTTQALKHVLDRPDLGVGFHLANSLPSGHTTVVTSAVAALLLVLPAGTRPLMAFVGTAAVGVTGLSTVVAGWHRPADVAAALLVVLLWTSIVAATVHGRRGRGLAAAMASLVGGAVAVVGLLTIGVRPEHSWRDAVLAAGVLGLVALCAAFVVTLMVTVIPAHD